MHLCSSYQQLRAAAGSITTNSKQFSTYLASIAACAAASFYIEVPHISRHTGHHLAPACCPVHPCRRSAYSCCRHNSNSQLCHHSSDISPVGHLQLSRLHMCCSDLEPMATISCCSRAHPLLSSSCSHPCIKSSAVPARGCCKVRICAHCPTPGTSCLPSS